MDRPSDFGGLDEELLGERSSDDAAPCHDMHARLSRFLHLVSYSAPTTLTILIKSISDSSPFLFSFRQYSASKSMSDVLRTSPHYSMCRHAFGLLIVTPLLLPVPLADMISESWLKHLLPLGFVRIPVAARSGKLMQSIALSSQFARAQAG